MDLTLSRYVADRRRLGNGNLTIENLMAVIRKYGLTGRSFAISVDHPDANIGHYMIVQCTMPEQWDHITDGPVEGSSDSEVWKVEDFQLYHACKDIQLDFSKGRVLQIIGRKEGKGTVYGSSKESIEWFFQQSPVEGSKRALPTVHFDKKTEKWSYSIQHHGEPI